MARILSELGDIFIDTNTLAISEEIFGLDGNDTIFASGGNDTIRGGDDFDTLDGGAGNDIVDGGNNDDRLFLSAGNDTYIGGSGSDILDMTFDRARGNIDRGNYEIEVPIVPGTPNLVVERAVESVRVDIANGQVVINGQTFTSSFSGIEQFNLWSGGMQFRGDDNGQVINGTGDGNDLIYGRGGEDRINAGGGDDTVFAGSEDDSVEGNNGNDFLDGGSGNDTINDFSGNDTIRGQSGNDTINAGIGNDNVDGGTDNDTIDGGFGNDVLAGGDGIDTASFVSWGSPDPLAQLSPFGAVVTTIDLTLGTATRTTAPGTNFSRTETDTLSGFENVIGSGFGETIVGTSADNRFEGGGGSDTLDGGRGNDTLLGGSGGDTLLGGIGNDVLDGGSSLDTLDGGAGNDTFDFNLASDSTAIINGAIRGDLIVNFDDSATNNDVIDLSGIDANSTLANDQRFFLDDGDGVVEQGELILSSFNDANQGGNLVSLAFADVTGDGNADFGIRFGSLVTTLDASDFLL